MKNRILITGGAGFIGYNYALHRHLRGDDVTILDDTSRKGSPERYLDLQTKGIKTISEKCQNIQKMEHFDVVVHLAGQPAVTRSIAEPWWDCQDNIMGTLNLLEEIRNFGRPFPKIIFASTNKVYGPRPIAYEVDESEPINLRTPYGVSKGAADFYMQEYGRHYDMPTVILRQSCIYGKHQTAESDQGWLMHFARSIMEGKEITIYGDGKQVRDLLYIDDVTLLYDLLLDVGWHNGDVYNVGGGTDFAINLLEAIGLISAVTNKKAKLKFEKVRPDDQRYYVSDITKVRKRTGWFPTIAPHDGISRLVQWIEYSNHRIHT